MLSQKAMSTLSLYKLQERQTERQTDRQILLFALIALGWSISPSPNFFVLTNAGCFDLRHLCFWCPEMEELYHKSQVEIKVQFG